jgi:hypothetical protein
MTALFVSHVWEKQHKETGHVTNQKSTSYLEVRKVASENPDTISGDQELAFEISEHKMFIQEPT